MVPRSIDLKIKLATILPELDERQRRLLVAMEAVELGYGGVSAVSEITGMSRNTILRGIDDLDVVQKSKNKGDVTGRIRKRGGGRKRVTEVFPELESVIENLLEPSVRGDPESPLRWTCKSVRNISDLLKGEGYEVSRQTIAAILHDLEFSLQGNRKTKEGKDHPDRDRQFRYINRASSAIGFKKKRFKPTICDSFGSLKPFAFLHFLYPIFSS